MFKLPGPANGLSIGLLGGSFNPAHEGHLHVAETAMRAANLDWVWWLPARGNPLKSTHGDYRSRVASSARFTNSQPRMRISEIEDQLGLTYSIDTINALKARAPSARFVWLMGADSLASFHLWKKWQDIARAVPILVIARPGAEQASIRSPFAQRFASARVRDFEAGNIAFVPAPVWTYLPAPLNALSSTELRRR